MGGMAAGARFTRDRAWLWKNSSWAEEAVGSGAVSLLSSVQLHGSVVHGHSEYSGLAMGEWAAGCLKVDLEPKGAAGTSPGRDC